jgi:hypothetical protein
MRLPTGLLLVGVTFLAGLVVSLVPSWRKPPELSRSASVSEQFMEAPTQDACEPLLDSAQAVTFPDDLEVIGISTGGMDRAYILGTLEQVGYHVLNDLVGRASVSVTYCDRLNCARVFTGGETGHPLSLRAAGFSLEGGMVLDSGAGWYFQKSDRPASPNTIAPTPYHELESVRTTWGQWRALHPRSSVAYYPCLATDTWQRNYSSPLVEVSPGEPVVGLTLKGLHRAYLLRAFHEVRSFVTRDSLADVWMTLIHNVTRNRTRALIAARPEANAAPVTFAGWDAQSGEMILAHDGHRYECDTGASRDGADQPPFPFREVPLVFTTWAEWRDAHPDTTINVGEFRDLVHLPQVEKGGWSWVGSLEHLMPFIPGCVLLLLWLVRRALRRYSRWGTGSV